MFNFSAPFRRFGCLIIVAALTITSGTQSVQAAARLKDIANVQGVRDNLLVGYGLVVGLNGTGDKLSSAVFTRESLIAMLERLGVNARDDKLDAKNIAAVMVTATLPPFTRQGSRIDIVVSALGSASSLQGGTLLVTPLMGADGEVYGVAQGSVAVAGFQAQGASGSSVSRGVPTVARIASGAIVEREVNFDFNSLQSINLSLRNPDFTTADRIAKSVNKALKEGVAFPTDPSTVVVQVPSIYKNNLVAMITDMEQLPIEIDQVAKVVIDEQSGVIVIGQNVRISTVAIAQGNLTIRITETPQVSQPGAFSQGGSTEVVPRSQVQVDEQSDRKLAVLSSGVTLQEMVNGLNALGIGPRDMITILQAIKAAGAMQAEIEVM
jgi:flagellar P-ring protein precursor FlgI